jgi:hypothetical protein
VLSGTTRATFAPTIKKSSLAESDDNGSVEVQITANKTE